MYKLFAMRVRLVFSLFAFAILAAACTGDTGEQGAKGDTGDTGGTGDQGEPGNSTVDVEFADRIDVTVISVTVPTGGGKPEVVYRLSNDVDFGLTGMPAASVSFTIAQLTAGVDGGSSEWQSYITKASATIPDAQATTENATVGVYTDNDDGTYTYTFSSDLTAYPAGPAFSDAKTHRLGLEIRTQYVFLPYNIPANNAPYDFVPNGGPMTDTRLIVNNDTCNACHDNLELHGEARFDVEYCVTCHNPYSIDGETVDEAWGGKVDMKVMVHKIHRGIGLANGYFIVGYGGSVHDYSEIHFPQDIRNCLTCHQESDTTVPQASNWRTVPNRESCGACHDDIDWANGGHPGGVTFDNDVLCVDCHGEFPTIGNDLLKVDVVHQIPEAIAAEAFEYEVVSVSNGGPGDTPTVAIRVLDPTHPDYGTDPDSTAYDLNDPEGPFQVGRARLRVDVSWNTDELGNLDPSDGLARPADSGAPFAPIAIDFKTGAVNDGNNVFSKAAPAAIPSTATGSGLAILEGYPQVLIDDVLTSVAVVASGIPFVITDTTAEDRRHVVDIGKCNDCHNTLALHGDNRVGNTELCSTCHNPNATDIQQRGVADTACDDELGADDVSIDLKRMVHRIHAGNVGVCGYRNSAHDYTDVVYPGRLNNCEGCHLPGTYFPVDPTEVLATTVDAGADRSTLTDDVAISPNTAVCSSCHMDFVATEHMKQNGGDFEAQKDDTGAMTASGFETCELCHGPGGTADVKVMHGVDTFQSN